MNDKKTNEKYEIARKRVEEIKGFYSHLIVYLIVITYFPQVKILFFLN